MTVPEYKDYELDYDVDTPLNVEERGFVQWTTGNNVQFFPASQTCSKLPPGIYDIAMNPNEGVFFNRLVSATEGLVRFPQSNSDKVIDEIQKFWNNEELFRKYDLTYKRGIILYGPAGSGKTCTIKFICNDVIKRKGIVINFTEPDLFLAGVRILKKIQDKIPMVVLMEDIDAILEKYNESSVLNILDGIEQIEKSVFLATTNYPEDLGARVINRPSRFDKRFFIGHPNEKSRKMYFEHLIGKNEIKKLKIDLDKWVKDTDNMSLAHLKELFISVVIQEDTYEESIDSLRKMVEEKLDSKDYEHDEEFGFNIKK